MVLGPRTCTAPSFDSFLLPRSLLLAALLCSSLDVSFPKSDTKASKMQWNNQAPVSLNRIEVAVDTAHEQHPTSRTSLSVGTQQGDKPHELRVGSDLPVECAMETGITESRP
jgi:hypothetical protein